MYEWLWYLIVIFTLASLIPACYSDIKTRKVPVWLWYPGVYIAIPLSIVLFILKIFAWEIPINEVYLYVGTALVMVIISLVAGYANLFGGADAIAFCLVALTSFYYVDPINMRHPLFIFMFMANFIAFAILITVGIFVKNVVRKNYRYIKNPILLFCTTMVKPSELDGNHFLVMEDVRVTENGVRREPIDFSLRMTETDIYKSSVITASPERFAAYRQLDQVLVMYLIPMVIPITCAYITTIIIGSPFMTFITPFIV